MTTLRKIINFLFNKINFYNNFSIKNIFFNKIYNKVIKVNHNGHDFNFHTPNWITLWRAKTFSTKEPETLEWIDKFDNNCIFWDIGANIGTYSIYATKVKNATTFSFEPSVFNLEFLAKNINANNLENKINIFPIALSDSNNINKFNMSNIEWGSALSTFSKSYDANGKDLIIKFSYNTIGIRADDAVKFFNIPYPKYIKIDVDGIEHLILSGMPMILESAEQVLIELSNVFNDQIEIATKILIDKGFILSNKYIENDINISTNQIWKKS
jgi:FkbM family methyltransferase